MPDQDAVKTDVRALLREAAAIGAQLAREHPLHPTDARAMRVLDAVADVHVATPGRLADELGLSPAATTALVDRLVAAGLVERVRDLPDRRQVRLRLTEHARAASRELLEPLGHRIDAAVDRLDPASAATVAAFLADVLRRRQDGAPDADAPG